MPEAVVALYVVSAGPSVQPAVAEAILAGAPPAEVKALMPPGELDAVLHARRSLAPLVYPRRQYLRLFLTKAEGIYFVCYPGMRRTMGKATLDVMDGELVLKDQAGEVLLPRKRERP